MNLPAQASPDEQPLESFERELEAEYERAKQTKKEIDLMLKQSEAEMAKLTKRNADISAQLQQVQSQIETMPRSDIKSTYNSAMDAQQRLLVMRAQVEKMQNDVAAWARYIGLLEKVIEQLSRGFKPSAGGAMSARTMSSGSMMLENMINAQEAERESLSKRMHDGPAQALSNFIVQTEIASRFLDIDAMRAKEEMGTLKNAALSTFKEVRTFIFELRPMMLDDLGLFPTITRYCESFKEQTGCDVTCTIKGGTQESTNLLSFQNSMLFRAIQELIGNAYRHNSENPTRIQIAVNVVVDENVIKVTVNDNGKGFEPEGAFRNDKMSGLRIIRERVEMLGGHMEIDSGIGRGARVFFQVPKLEAEG
jgi:two-component system sensor histidine kinase DegS